MKRRSNTLGNVKDVCAGSSQTTSKDTTKKRKRRYKRRRRGKKKKKYKPIKIESLSDNRFDQEHPIGQNGFGKVIANSIEIKSLSENLFMQNFEELRQMGQGTFGTVIKAKEKSTQELFAIKRINLKDQNGQPFDEDVSPVELQREVTLLAKTSGDYVVHYFDSWFEFDKTLYIQMELCSTDLYQLIDEKRNCFQRKVNEEMDVIEYFISGQLFQEIVECVLYLHSNNIIHRDLKPQNILITEQPINGRRLKIGDFGLAKSTGNQTMTHTANKGTFKYMAPEVYEGRYSNKADIYSLGKIAQDLFELDIDRTKQPNNTELKSKWKAMGALINRMLSYPSPNRRPTCDKVLASFNKWGIKSSELSKYTINRADEQALSQYSNSFFLNYYNLKSQMSPCATSQNNNNMTKRKRRVKKMKKNNEIIGKDINNDLRIDRKMLSSTSNKE